MSARIEWVNANYATIEVIPGGEEAPDQGFVEPGNVGILITGENGDGVVIEGDHVELMKLLLAATEAIAQHLKDGH